MGARWGRFSSGGTLTMTCVAEGSIATTWAVGKWIPVAVGGGTVSVGEGVHVNVGVHVMVGVAVGIVGDGVKVRVGGRAVGGGTAGAAGAAGCSPPLLLTGAGAGGAVTSRR